MNRNQFPTCLTVVAFLLLICLCTNSCSSGKKEYMIHGTVQRTEQGKDGYTAVLKADDGSDFEAVFSKVTLGDEYRVFTEGERLRVSGDTLHINGRLRVMVRKINP